jgi:Holliday junction resolvase-like predicted endonuclease
MGVKSARTPKRHATTKVSSGVKPRTSSRSTQSAALQTKRAVSQKRVPTQKAVQSAGRQSSSSRSRNVQRIVKSKKPQTSNRSNASQKTLKAKGRSIPAHIAKLNNQQIGARSEKHAQRFLEKKGYQVNQGQHNSTHGIDLIAFKDGKPTFVEVKGSRDQTRPFSVMQKQVSKPWIRGRFVKLEKSGKHKDVVAKVRKSFGLKPGDRLPGASSSKWKGAGISVNLANNKLNRFDASGRKIDNLTWSGR